MPRIREAVRSDVERSLQLMEAYWAFEQAPGFESGRIRRQLEDFLCTPKFGRAWIAEEGERAVGYVVAAYVYSFEYGGSMAELDELFVVEGSRGRGLGRALIATACEALERHGCVAVQLQVADWNEGSALLRSRRVCAEKRVPVVGGPARCRRLARGLRAWRINRRKASARQAMKRHAVGC